MQLCLWKILRVYSLHGCKTASLSKRLAVRNCKQGESIIPALQLVHILGQKFDGKCLLERNRNKQTLFIQKAMMRIMKLAEGARVSES